jgi:hypothetical protein
VHQESFKTAISFFHTADSVTFSRNALFADYFRLNVAKIKPDLLVSGEESSETGSRYEKELLSAKLWFAGVSNW